jgi:hypothetical protein
MAYQAPSFVSASGGSSKAIGERKAAGVRSREEVDGFVEPGRARKARPPLGPVRGETVEALEAFEDRPGGRVNGLDHETGARDDLVDRGDVRGLGHGQSQRAAAAREGDHLELRRPFPRHSGEEIPDQTSFRERLRNVDGGDAVAARERCREHRFREVAELDQRGSEKAAP